MTRSADLADAWRDLLGRRPAFRDALGLYEAVFEAWARETPAVTALALDATACRARWEAGVPLVDEAAAQLHREHVEEPLGAAMEALAQADAEVAPGLQRLAEEWDAGRIGPPAFLARAGRIGSGAVEAVSGLSPAAVAFLAIAALRPALEALFADVRAHLDDAGWPLGTCPWCGGPPGFVDVVEDGRRRLACHLCGGSWGFAKLRCPFCGIDGAAHLVRLAAEGELREEGYVIAACRECRAYVKELDRRTRWNGGPPLVEDWGSPHFDLIALRHGYWRPGPSVVELGRGGEPDTQSE